MSFRVNGFSCTAVPSSHPYSLVSHGFYSRVAPNRLPGDLLSVTVDTPFDGSLTVLLRCRVADAFAGGPDLSLGMDWKASVRELLISVGHRVPESFDPFNAYFSVSPGELTLVVPPYTRAAVTVPRTPVDVHADACPSSHRISPHPDPIGENGGFM
ncbi:hypothetical protein B0H19DRAFT_1382836 [Mycena capillaripes]|nr:hypothetical protein B0H19DRAFT_1382836 [Mycena capillaripes]